MGPWRLAVLGLAAVLCVPAASEGQLETMMSPELGKVMPRAEYRFSFWPERPVVGQSTDFSVTQHRVTFTTPLVQDARDEWSLGGRVRLDEFDTHAHLPDTGGRLPTELWDIRLEPGYRHRFDNGWVASGNVSVGSASDKPFASEDELVVRAMGFLRVPQGERNAWLFTLNYTNYSEFFGGFPVPGIDFLYSPNDDFTLVFGFPFTYLEWKPFEKLTLQMSYTPVRTVKAKVTYEVFRPLRVYAGFDWDDDWYLRADRTRTNDRLFYYEKRLTGGIRFDLRHVGFEVSGGYAFDRFYFEAEKYRDRNNNRIDIHSGPFVIGKISLRF